MKFIINKVIPGILMIFIIMFVFNTINDKPDDVDSATESIQTESRVGTNEYSKELAEQNAIKYPASSGKSLVTKGDNNFTAMPYYFKGELMAIGKNEVFGNNPVWLVKNDSGYTMPIEFGDSDDAEIGDVIEVWGRLSGEGYSLDVENVVGETGYLRMFQYAVNGENMQ